MSKVEKDCYWIVPRDKPGLLIAMMRALVGNAHISFEGNLSRCTFPPELSPSPNETPGLKRSNLGHELDFLVLPLEGKTIRPILDVVLPDRRALEDIIHIQIEKDDQLQFGSYDNFHSDCIVCFHGVSVDLLNRLQSSGVIRSWTEPYEGAQRWHG